MRCDVAPVTVDYVGRFRGVDYAGSITRAPRAVLDIVQRPRIRPDLQTYVRQAYVLSFGVLAPLTVLTQCSTTSRKA